MESIVPSRDQVSDRFPVASFEVSLPRQRCFEVACATDPRLFHTDWRHHRTASNFYSSRGEGLLRAPEGRTAWFVPPTQLRRFAGARRVYYALATYGSPRGDDAHFTISPEGLDRVPSIGLAPDFTGRGLDRRRLGVREPMTDAYGAVDAAALAWGGDDALRAYRGALAAAAESAGDAPDAPDDPEAGGGRPADSGAYDDGYPADLWDRPVSSSAAYDGDDDGNEDDDAPAAAGHAADHDCNDEDDEGHAAAVMALAAEEGAAPGEWRETPDDCAPDQDDRSAGAPAYGGARPPLPRLRRRFRYGGYAENGAEDWPPPSDEPPADPTAQAASCDDETGEAGPGVPVAEAGYGGPWDDDGPDPDGGGYLADLDRDGDADGASRPTYGAVAVVRGGAVEDFVTHGRDPGYAEEVPEEHLPVGVAPAALSAEPLATVALDIPEKVRVLRVVAVAESGADGYSAINADTEYNDPHHPAYHRYHIGLSWGFIQFTQRSGALGRVLRAVKAREDAPGASIPEPQRFPALFGPSWEELLRVTAAGDGDSRVQPVGGANLWEPVWTARFRAAGAVPHVTYAQNEIAITDYLDPALPIARWLGFDTPRALAMLVDRCIHMGAGGGIGWTMRAVGPVRNQGDLETALRAVGAEDVRAFQRTRAPDLAVDGRWGPRTHAALTGALRTLGSGSPIPVPGRDEMLRRMAEAARGTSFERRLHRLYDDHTDFDDTSTYALG